MNHSDFSTEDLIVDEQFIRWVNQPDEDLNSYWADWMKKNPSKIDQLEEAKSFIKSLAFEETALPDNEVKGLLQNINQNIDEDEKMAPTSTKTRSLRWISVAASIILLITAGLWWTGSSNNTYTTAFNETQTILLPDGTEVILNANSSMESPKKWNDQNNREVWLEGEAFFHVTKKPTVGSRKFVVHAKGVDVEVLGTAFNVNARQDKTSIVLKSGKIQLRTSEQIKSGASPMALVPGERVLLEPKGIGKSNVNTEVYTAWTSQKIILDNTALTHIIDILENNYGFQVEVKDQSILEKKLTGTAPLNKDPKVLLKSLGAMFNIKIEQKENGKIVIQ